MKTIFKGRVQIMLIVTLLFLCLTIGCEQQASNRVSKVQAKLLIDGYLKFRNEGDLTAADEIMHPECVIRYPNLPQEIVGLEALKEYDKTTRLTFPDFKMTIDDFFVKDDKIIAYWTLDVTNTGPLASPKGELPPTNKKVNISGIAVSKIVDGKIIEDVAYFDMLSFMQQLGFTMVPPAPLSAEKM